MKQIIVDNVVTNYFIDENGLCYNKKTGEYLKGQVSNSGYLNYNLRYNGIVKRHYAHRLVAQAYLSNPNNFPVVNHKDGNKLNNNMNNLEWTTASANQKHAIKNGLRKFKTIYQYNVNKELINSYKTLEDVARAGFDLYSVSNEVRKPDNKPKNLTIGFYWSYSSEPNFMVEEAVNTGKAKIVYQYDKSGKLLGEYPSVSAAAKAVGGVHSHIGECCRGKLKSYKGFVWSYNNVDDIVSTSMETQSCESADRLTTYLEGN